MQTLLFYTTDRQKQSQLQLLCRRLGISFRAIARSQLCCSLMSLAAGMPGPAPGGSSIPALYAQPELLVFSGFSSDALDRFLAAYRSSGLAPIALRAVLTPTNSSWSVYTLTTELRREHSLLQNQS